MADSGSDVAWYATPPPRQRYRGMRYSSFYLTMRDGVRIAVTLCLPSELADGDRLPAILNQTRYFRSMELRQPLRTLLGGKALHHIPSTARSRKRFVANRYAWVDVDVRGTGASYGSRVSEWSPDEIRDGAQIVDWIVSQPWSNGRVGALGSSYSGAAAEFLLANAHPAVRAVAPRFALFDAYPDIAFPGGIHAAWFTETWGRYNDALDRNAPHEVAGRWLKLLVTGVRPVDDDRDRSLRANAIAAHRDNYDVHEQALSLTFRDDVAPSDPYHNDLGGRLEPVGTPIDDSGSLNLVSPHNYWRDIESSGAAIYSYGGWFDGAYGHSAVKRFLTITTPGSRLILGPWNHGGKWHVEPFRQPSKTSFDHEGELLRFFDSRLTESDTGIESEPRVRYFTMGEGRWKSADTWPPAATPLIYFLAADQGLDAHPPASDSDADRYVVDNTTATGEHSRWRTQVAIGEAVQYPDRSIEDRKLLTYTSAPLDRPLEVTGHPVMTLFVESSASDGTFFVYLEDVDEHGRVALVTEGQLRAIHRRRSAAAAPYRDVVRYRTFKRGDARPLVSGEIAELTIDLLPTSYLFDRGHRLRVAIAGADASHFAILPGGRPTVHIHRNRLNPSRIDLPVVPR